ncbi:MAG: radical SAM protein [Planctomycetaceae bacterium]|jgi:uncharacterized protein|nr:radical SAM protein [Planctomycetaceae bacterium]
MNLLNCQQKNNILQLCSLPKRMIARSLELELTTDCNLRCVYCYKGEEHRKIYMSQRTAFDAIIWFLYATGYLKKINVYFMGGEPLLHFDMIKKLVPFATRRAIQQGKEISFSATTNCMLVNDEVIDFFKKWKMKFHTSIDGIPTVQNENRPDSLGKSSSPTVLNSVRKILDYQPTVCARATLLPNHVEKMIDSYRFFRSLGYKNIAIVPGEYHLWDKESISQYSNSLKQIADFWSNEIRNGIHIGYHGFSGIFRNRNSIKRSSIACGAGRGLLSIDSFGNTWPCNHWDSSFGEKWTSWKIGNIYDKFSEETRDYFLSGNEPPEKCNQCLAKVFCAGGCHGSNIDTTGQIKQIHPNACLINQVHAKVVIALHDELYAEKCPTFMEHYYPQEWKKINEEKNMRDHNNEHAAT